MSQKLTINGRKTMDNKLDWVDFRRKVTQECIQQGIALPTDRAIRSWHNQDHIPTGRWLMVVAKVLEVTPDELVIGFTKEASDGQM